MLGKTLFISALVVLSASLAPSSRMSGGPLPTEAAKSFHWESRARLRGVLRSKPGTLVLDELGVEFRPDKGPPLRWPFVEVHVAAPVTPRRLKLTTYENKSWRRSGDREFRFELSDPMPPAVAREFVRRTAKPAMNGIPDPAAPSFASIPARYRTRSGGSNGVLRFREQGIDYVAAGGRGSRTWRWSDIQTLANPDPYHFRVAGFLETFDFELKQPMPRELFDRLWDFVYARDLMVTPVKGEKAHEMDEN